MRRVTESQLLQDSTQRLQDSLTDTGTAIVRFSYFQTGKLGAELVLQARREGSLWVVSHDVVSTILDSACSVVRFVYALSGCTYQGWKSDYSYMFE